MRQLAANLLRRWLPVIDAITGISCWTCGDAAHDDSDCTALGCGCTGLL